MTPAQISAFEKELADCKELSQLRYEYIGRLQQSEWKLQEEVRRLREAKEKVIGAAMYLKTNPESIDKRNLLFRALFDLDAVKKEAGE